MSIEKIYVPPQKGGNEEGVSADQKIEQLLTQLPSQLRERWEEEIDGVAPADAVSLLENVIEKRREARTSALKDPASPEISEEKLRTVIRLRDAVLSRGVELGEGKVAKVYTDPSDSRRCYKVVQDHGQYHISNTVVQEGSFLEELDGFSHAGVRTPSVYSSISAPEFTAIGMERLPGMSLEQILELESLPPSFNTQQYFASMRAYVEEMLNQHHVYHRDLRAGNMMFDPETGDAFLIDFGRAVHAYPNQDGFLEFTFQRQPVKARNTNEERLRYVESIFRKRFG